MGRSFTLYGVSISPGIVVGKPYFLLEKRNKIISKKLPENELDGEIDRYRTAINKSKKDLEHLQKRYIKDGASVVVEILDAHLGILHDPIITQLVEEKIKLKQRNTEAVFSDVLDEYKRGFRNIKDEFIEERINDIKDVSRRILSHLSSAHKINREKAAEDSIIIANDLIPSDALGGKFSSMLAFVTQKGGYTSHSGIIARAKGIPFVSKVDIKELSAVEIENLIVDGINGKIIANPDKATIEEYLKLQNEYKKYFQEIESANALEPLTKDNIKISLLSNIESENDITSVLQKQSEGVGLFRSEYLFLTEQTAINEDRQFQVYKNILEKLDGKPAAIRLFDIGGDKNHFIISSGRSSFKLKVCEKEQNPVLGCRGIRFLMKNEAIFDEQLRALLRASVYGNLKILIPLLSDIVEFRLVKSKISKLTDSLVKEGVNVKKDIPLGCMIEVPSAALMIDDLAKEVDFFSIGTNDLTQYVMASDRSNCDTSHLYDFSHPALLKMISQIVKSVKKNKKEVSVCGEMAADPKFTNLLIGIGVRSFSVAVRHLPFIKHAIRKTDLKEAKKQAKRAQEQHQIV